MVQIWGNLPVREAESSRELSRRVRRLQLNRSEQRSAPRLKGADDDRKPDGGALDRRQLAGYNPGLIPLLASIHIDLLVSISFSPLRKDQDVIQPFELCHARGGHMAGSSLVCLIIRSTCVEVRPKSTLSAEMAGCSVAGDRLPDQPDRASGWPRQGDRDGGETSGRARVQARLRI